MIRQTCLSDHCFRRPLAVEDNFHPIKTTSGRFDLKRLGTLAEERGRQIAFRWKATRLDSRVHTPAEMRSELAERLYCLLTSSQYRRGSIDLVNSAKSTIISKIEDAVDREEPIELLMEFFAFKMRNCLRTLSQDGTEVDVSEAGTILRFHEIANAVTEIYPPGAVFKVATDGTKFCHALETSPEVAIRYTRNIGLLGEMLGTTQTVLLYDEADFFDVAYRDLADKYYMQLKEEFLDSNQETCNVVSTLRNSINFMLPIGSNIPIHIVASAFMTGVEDDRLRQMSPDAYHLRMDVKQRALESTLKYMAVKRATTNALLRVAPKAIICCAHPRHGYLGLYIGRRGQTLFPHHCQGLTKSHLLNPGIDDLRCRYAADIRRDLRIHDSLTGLVLPKEECQFSNGVHPFTFVTNS
jgi:pyoverdine/dityrosine biosynthesis protein Dit1